MERNHDRCEWTSPASVSSGGIQVYGMYSVTFDGQPTKRILSDEVSQSSFLHSPFSHDWFHFPTSVKYGIPFLVFLFANYFTLYAKLCICVIYTDAVNNIVSESKKDSRLQ